MLALFEKKSTLGYFPKVNLNPTAENIAVVIWNKLRPYIEQKNDLEVVLYETPRNFVTYKGN